jgi:hypothetical protein
MGLGRRNAAAGQSFNPLLIVVAMIDLDQKPVRAGMFEFSSIYPEGEACIPSSTKSSQTI